MVSLLSCIGVSPQSRLAYTEGGCPNYQALTSSGVRMQSFNNYRDRVFGLEMYLSSELTTGEYTCMYTIISIAVFAGLK